MLFTYMHLNETVKLYAKCYDKVLKSKNKYAYE